MARDTNGTYTLEFGSPSNVQPGTTIQSAWANGTLDDIAEALTNSLDRQGRGGMLAPFKFANGLQTEPSITWSNEPNTGFWRPGTVGDMRLSVLGSDLMRWNNTSVQIWANSQWNDVVYDGGPGGMPDGSTDYQSISWDNTANDWTPTSALLINFDTGTVTTASDLAVAGDILVGGTVDGRDVNVDGNTMDAHIQDPFIHYDDVPIDNIQYARKNRTWAVIDPTGAVIPDGTAEGQTLRWDNTAGSWDETATILQNADDSVSIATAWIDDNGADSGIWFGGAGSKARGIYGKVANSSTYIRGGDIIFSDSASENTEKGRFDANGRLGVKTEAPNANSNLDVAEVTANECPIYTAGLPLLAGAARVVVRATLPTTPDSNTLYFLTT